jgi:hypothetical protein
MKKIILTENQYRLLLENEAEITITADYLKKRVPFFKSFDETVDKNHIKFRYYKNWNHQDAIKIYLGENGFLEIPFFSIEVKFEYTTSKNRDFKTEMETGEVSFLTEHEFLYWIDIQHDFGDINDSDDFAKQLALRIASKMIKEDLQINEKFTVKEGEEFPFETLNRIVNKINKNLFEVEDFLGKFDVKVFEEK